jgi:PKD repeat protein
MKNPSFMSRTRSKFVLLTVMTLFKVADGYGQSAYFTADVTSGCFPLKVRFTPAAGSTSWSWDFGDGNSSIFEIPETIYEHPGIYTVKLTASNGSQTNSSTRTGYILVRDVPTVQFSIDKTSGCSPLKVKFKDESSAGSGSITSWLWVFGDGGTSTSNAPEYIYNTAGPKSVSLRVRNQFGCESTGVKPALISVSGPATSFTVSSTSACQVPATIQFTNTSTGTGPLTYSWDFGDGTNSTETSLLHTFTKPGVFNVSLKARDGQGCESSHTTTVRVGSEGGLDFSMSGIEVCEGSAVTFTTLATDPILSRQWNFGNGTSSTMELHRRPQTR